MLSFREMGILATYILCYFALFTALLYVLFINKYTVSTVCVLQTL